MTDPGVNARDQSELLDLLELLREERATQAEVDRIEAIVLHDPSAMDFYTRYMAMTASLRHRLQGLPGLVESAVGLRRDTQAAPPLARRPWKPALAAAAIVLAAVTAAIVLLINRAAPPLSPVEIAQVSAVQGDARVLRGDGASQAVTAALSLYSGDTVKTLGQGSSATVTYPDGTRLVLVHDCSLTSVDGRAKSVVLHGGIVTAHVAAQPAEYPMLVATPSAKVEVLGTAFALAAGPDRTEVNVSQGRVRLTRVSDGQAVDVGEGQAVVSNGESKLVVVDRGGAKDTWGEDFEDGVPKGWAGTLVAASLPPGSHGAITMVREDKYEQPVFRIASREAWIDGLFAIHPDSHLHVTFKMQKPDWLNIFVATRTATASQPSWTLNIFNEVPYWPPKPGEWRTVTIPLDRFKRKRDGVFRDEPPAVGDVAYSVSISATEDRGLVVDRIWVTRGGPGEVKAVRQPAE